ncbi:hypothetical protein H8F24_17375 [Synechococcus sp. CBW1002]|nr:hypothetical protein [Synechococcus sp. CBW1002]QPN59701.1 hypothetical protein H8F24_17375 [Synechococcus sp. CBW1002]
MGSTPPLLELERDQGVADSIAGVDGVQVHHRLVHQPNPTSSRRRRIS